jgi:histidinol-phosphate aminotransferase
MSWLGEIARAEIRALKPYEHAGWEPGLVRLHANELPWRAPGDASIAGLNSYPEPHPFALADRLGELYGVPGECVLAARGSDEAIDLLTRVYCRAGQDAIVITPPTFGMYAVTARIQDAGVIAVPLRRAAGYAFDPAALRAALTPAVKLVYLCSPNNPTGNSMDRGALLELARDLEGRALLVVDEAYVEFSTQPPLTPELAHYPGLVLLRTLSKAYGLAGARCGALLAAPEIVALLRRVIQPYALTQLTIEAVYATLQGPARATARERVATLLAERLRLGAALAALPRVTRVWPSDANFLLVEFRDPAAALARTHAAGLLLRDLRGAATLAQALRISIGTREQNDRLLEALA